MDFDKCIRAGWLLLAAVALVIWCAFPKIRVIRISSDVAVQAKVDGDVSSTLSGNRLSPIVVEHH